MPRTFRVARNPDEDSTLPYLRSCVRRGVAIDLVLDRYRESRSQFVVTTLKGGREGIFWQTSKTTRKTRPGMRLPTRRSPVGVLEIVVDTRERFRLTYVSPSIVAEMLAAAPVRYPNVPIMFCENRQLAQEWAYRFLGAAAAFADEEADEL